ncbi:MAG: hypothetical protein IJQ85_01310 [Selenomonadaceae bacterium]|nr:hypothetical protein [Selenomonadaceae bacterium]
MAQVQEQQQQVNISVNDLIFAQIKDLGKRMDRLEHRQDKLEEKLDLTRRELNNRMDKQDEKIEKLADKIDKLADKIDSSSNHGQISNITTIGIALAVIYAVLK